MERRKGQIKQMIHDIKRECKIQPNTEQPEHIEHEKNFIQKTEHEKSSI